MDRPEPPPWVEGVMHEEWFIGARAAQEDWHYSGRRGDTGRDLGNSTRNAAYRAWMRWMEVEYGQGEEGGA